MLFAFCYGILSFWVVIGGALVIQTLDFILLRSRLDGLEEELTEIGLLSFAICATCGDLSLFYAWRTYSNQFIAGSSAFTLLFSTFLLMGSIFVKLVLSDFGFVILSIVPSFDDSTMLKDGTLSSSPIFALVDQLSLGLWSILFVDLEKSLYTSAQLFLSSSTFNFSYLFRLGARSLYSYNFLRYFILGVYLLILCSSLMIFQQVELYSSKSSQSSQMSSVLKCFFAGFWTVGSTTTNLLYPFRQVFRSFKTGKLTYLCFLWLLSPSYSFPLVSYRL